MKTNEIFIRRVKYLKYLKLDVINDIQSLLTPFPPLVNTKPVDLYGVCPRERFLDLPPYGPAPSPINFVHDH